jgi:hypothetical protein
MMMRVLELHAPLKVISRSHGRSAVAAAAYRSASRLVDERTGLTHDFRNRGGVEATAMLVPDEAPEWATDRAQLWSQAELRETRKDSQTARDLEVSLPREFSAAQRREAGLRIGQWLVSRYGVAVDLAWHEPSRRNPQKDNVHLHVLFTTRRFENGEWARTKDRRLDDRKTGPEEVRAMRFAVADTLNHICTRDNIRVYVEHLSYEERGLAREATQHLGPIASNMERAGVATDIGDKNRAIRARNIERRKAMQERKAIEQALGRETGEPDAPRRASAGRLTFDEAYHAFCEDTLARRAAMSAAFQVRHGERERSLKERLAGLHRHQEAGVIARTWRFITGQTRHDRQETEQARSVLEAIAAERDADAAAFETDRLARLRELRQSYSVLEERSQQDASMAGRRFENGRDHGTGERTWAYAERASGDAAGRAHEAVRDGPSFER